MEDFRKRYGEWALVAGAAMGLGEAFSVALAERGINLLLVDIEHDEMDALAGRIQEKYNIRTRTLLLDLSLPDAPEKIMELITGHDCHLLIYVAAYSRVRPFLDNAQEELDRYVDVNMRTPLKVFHRFAGHLKANGPGGIVILSSLGSFWGTRLLIPYGATKAFDLILAEALYYELKEHDIDVMACVAGATATPAYLASNPRYGWPRPLVQEPQRVAEDSMRKLGKKAVYISGRSNRFTYFLMKLLSRKGAAGIFNKTIIKMYPE